ncbi:ead/Ea22-like family protein [Enterobacter asburiae]|uniref:ead/Ea22-like family protein n=1 Tax=Enterobacter asburiae TaxID=61645 RepID=UPI00296639BD|nr:ead/Ea22-like family protein [Enterobacter asburiae]MDW3573947.1 ead/Ea22-like family protein [Enterobacter asburiae]
MSNIDKQALRNLARRATPGPWTMEHENIWYYENGFTKHLAYFCQGDDVDDSQDDVNTRYVAAADPATVLALLDELEAAEKKTVEMPTFDGYVPHVARELQAAFRIACDNAGINVAAAAGKGE